MVESLSHCYSDAYKRMFLIPHPDGIVSRIIPVLFPTAATSTALCYKGAVINHVTARGATSSCTNPGQSCPFWCSFMAASSSTAVLLTQSTNLGVPTQQADSACYSSRSTTDLPLNTGFRQPVTTATDRADYPKPLIIKRLVLIQPFFGGLTRTASELRLQDDPYLPLHVTELMWNLGLPLGANRSHEYCDPRVGGGSGLLDQVRDFRWRVGVMASDDDPLFDVNVELVKSMERRGVRVTSKISRGKGVRHGAFITFPPNKNEMFRFVRSFGFFS
ncbi:hypothetical protein Cgig2_025542 [Carnegiea gigantea]|uniref:Alpha/beta hydrolase fold-3 domain-containing protein n=1 Tax=Carnegiea gigantea TaxID=171969 RepID=A0A9Q1KB09_9CARY|nr:hypothetical protein Cgig2_025542 [Carnegiea gigantea]